jgi:hypothetical protein
MSERGGPSESLGDLCALLRKLEAGATPAPWKVDAPSIYIWAERGGERDHGGMVADSAVLDSDRPPDTVMRLRGVGAGLSLGDNGALITALRNAAPRLLAAAEAAGAMADAMERLAETARKAVEVDVNDAHPHMTIQDFEDAYERALAIVAAYRTVTP